MWCRLLLCGGKVAAVASAGERVAQSHRAERLPTTCAQGTILAKAKWF
jgi:hypothetical protein